MKRITTTELFGVDRPQSDSGSIHPMQSRVGDYANKASTSTANVRSPSSHIVQKFRILWTAGHAAVPNAVTGSQQSASQSTVSTIDKASVTYYFDKNPEVPGCN